MEKKPPKQKMPPAFNAFASLYYYCVSRKSVLVVTISVGSIMMILSTGNSKISESLRLGEQALYDSDACLEESFLQFKKDPLYNGEEVLFPRRTCHIEIRENEGRYSFRVHFSSDKKYWRSIEAEAEIANGVIKINNWKETNLDVIK